jgi:hypothetical protein
MLTIYETAEGVTICYGYSKTHLAFKDGWTREKIEDFIQRLRAIGALPVPKAY